MKNIGVIGCRLSEEFFTAAEANGEKFLLKKILVPGQTLPLGSGNYAEAQQVENVEEIINDASIDMVIVAERQKSLAGQLVRAGKAVRVV
jgi:hypothetical protein